MPKVGKFHKSFYTPNEQSLVASRDDFIRLLFVHKMTTPMVLTIVGVSNM